MIYRQLPGLRDVESSLYEELGEFKKLNLTKSVRDSSPEAMANSGERLSEIFHGREGAGSFSAKLYF
jgi:hypothetical protein